MENEIETLKEKIDEFHRTRSEDILFEICALITELKDKTSGFFSSDRSLEVTLWR